METSLLILDRQRIYASGAALEITKPVRRVRAVRLSVVDPLPEAACL